MVLNVLCYDSMRHHDCVDNHNCSRTRTLAGSDHFFISDLIN